MNVELINNERKAKKPESWQVGARRVCLMRGLAAKSYAMFEFSSFELLD